MFGPYNLIIPTIHIIVVYALILSNKKKCGRKVFIYSLGSMSFNHLYRMYVDYGGYNIDISMILMVYVCKFTYFAYNV